MKEGAYGFEKNFLRNMKSYLAGKKNKKKRRLKVNKIFSEWERVTITA